MLFCIGGLVLAASFGLLYNLYAAKAAENLELRRLLQVGLEHVQHILREAQLF